MSIANSEAYRWRASAVDPACYQRRMLGIELFSHVGRHTIVFGVDCMLAVPLELPALVDAVRWAWVALRFAVPMIAVQTAQDETGHPIFSYHAAADQAEVEAWAGRTVKAMDPALRSYMDAHAQLAQLPTPDTNGDSTFLHVVAHTPTEYTLILHTQHAPFDGSSVKHIMSRLLSILARYIRDHALAKRELDELRWGNEPVNLSPAWSEITVEHEVVAGPEFDQVLHNIMQDARQILPRVHSYRSQSVEMTSDLACHVRRQLTEEDTSRILRYCKDKGLTVNQLFQSAVFLSTLRDNPAPADDAVFGCLGVVNLRSRLRPPFSNRHGYLGSCVTVFPLSASVADVASLDAAEQLYTLALLMKKEYERQKACVGLLGTSDAVIGQLIAAARARSLPRRTGAVYVGDGIGENDINHDFEDGVIRVTDFYLALRHITPGPCFRVYSWRGRLVLAVDYNGALWTRDTIEALMAHVLTDLVHTCVGKHIVL